MNKETKIQKSYRICIITAPYSKVLPAYALLLNYIEIFKSVANTIYVISGNIPRNNFAAGEVNYIDVNVNLDKKSIQKSMIVRAFMRTMIEIKICLNLLKISNRIDFVIFYSIPYYLLPVVLAKILKKKVMWIVAADSSKIASHNFGQKSIAKHVLNKLEKITFNLSDCIIAQSNSLIEQRGLNRYKNKVSPSGARFIDANKFNIKTKIDQRKNRVGYIGRFRGEKGVTKFVEAIPIILNERIDIEFVIIGDGPLSNSIEQKIKSYNHNNIVLKGWGAHESMPDHLNDLKLLVHPSYMEGLPTTILEAMACGTPVLATSVGGVPDLIKDGETGYILENNSPETIAESVIRIINDNNLRNISKNAKNVIDKEYSYDSALRRYVNIFKNV